jgi:hypothetical protein
MIAFPRPRLVWQTESHGWEHRGRSDADEKHPINARSVVVILPHNGGEPVTSEHMLATDAECSTLEPWRRGHLDPPPLELRNKVGGVALA